MLKFSPSPVRCEALFLEPSKQRLRYGNLYNPENIFIAKEFMANTGRFAAAPVARLVTELGGRDAYAALQLGTALLSLLSCVHAVPAMRLLLAHQ